MDAKAIRQAALITLRRAICERFPPGLAPMVSNVYDERLGWQCWIGFCWATPNPPQLRILRPLADGSGPNAGV